MLPIKKPDKHVVSVVLVQPGDPAPKGHSYIAASYVKFLESAGARVVPVLPDMPRDEVSSSGQASSFILQLGGQLRLILLGTPPPFELWR